MNAPRNLLQESLLAIEKLQARLTASERAKNEPIAIVGAACRYPGGADTPESLWKVLKDGVDAVSEVPSDRWDRDAYYDPNPQAVGKMVTKWGGFISRVEQFDPQFFGISPREAATMDPQQRLLLETAYEALESAGIALELLVGSRTGVFVGITTSDYGQRMRLAGPENSDVYSATGSALNAAAGRISFAFGFQGPCVALDTACSSSLVALHLACQSLRAGESNLALAGGVNIVLSPDAMVLFSKWGMMALDGRCKTFDAAADGFVRGEGCAVLALKRLSNAIADGDPILAVIRGSAVNSDGKSSGLTVPNGPAQQAVVRSALANAGLEPSDIDYVEAHGTGTPLGDPIEVEALGAVMCTNRPADRPLLIGSVKTNLGHTEAASGLAGVLKVVLSLQHETIPPHLHFSRPNPGIAWDSLAIKVPTAPTPWNRGSRARRAGVSSFGFSGTNAHVILEEAPLVTRDAQEAEGSPSRLLLLSARSEPALRAMARSWSSRLREDSATPLADFSATSIGGRVHHSRRLALAIDSKALASEALSAYAEGQASPDLIVSDEKQAAAPRVAFLFTGQGSQYLGMGRELYRSSRVFRAALDRCAELLAPYLPRPLLEVMHSTSEADAAVLESTSFAQPALFSLEYALAELWKSWGVTPAIVLGHSVGEYAAACVAGVMSLEDGIRLIAERGRLMQALPREGSMAAVYAPLERVRAAIAPSAPWLSIAAINGDEQIVVSGRRAELDALLERLTRDGIKSQPLAVSHAFHSVLLEPMLGDLESAARRASFQPPRVTLISNLTGAPVTAQSPIDAAYWRRHAREPVQFQRCVQAAIDAGCNTFVEIGPSPVLLSMVGRMKAGASSALIHSLRKGQPDVREIARAAGTLYVRGARLDWAGLAKFSGGRRVGLPTYAFQRERHWIAASSGTSRSAPVTGHPLLGERRELAMAATTYVWQSEISLVTHPWLRDHQVQGAAIVPAAAYIEMAFAAGAEVLGPKSLLLREIENLKPIILYGEVRWTVQAMLVEGSDGTWQFSVHSRQSLAPKAGGAHLPWTANMRARVSSCELPEGAAEGLSIVEQARARCGAEVDRNSFYSALAEKGNQWGPAFQGMERVWVGEEEAVGRIVVPQSVAGEVARYRFHPAISDSCGHSLVAAVSLVRPGESAPTGAFVGGGVGEVRFHRSPSGVTLWAHARMRSDVEDGGRVVHGDLRIYDESGALVSETFDAKLWYLEDSAASESSKAPTNWFYRIRWHQQESAASAPRAPADGTWLVLADERGVADAISKLRRAAGKRTVLVRKSDQWSCEADQATVRPRERDDWKRLLATVGPLAAVIDLWGGDAASSNVVPDAAIGGTVRVLAILQNLLASSSRARIWLVTAGAQPVTESDTTFEPWGASLWGVGRSLSAEHAENWGGLVDLEPAASVASSAERLVREVETGDEEDKIGFRGGERYVARLVRLPMISGEPTSFDADPRGTHLITGGLGGIGLAMAQWLVDRGARNLLLIGRTPLPAEGSQAHVEPDSSVGRRVQAIQKLRSGGARVEVAALDIADADALARCLESRRSRGEPDVAGVIHAAGVLSFAALESDDGSTVESRLAAKIRGAWNLHRLFEKHRLQYFALCSSSSVILNSPLLGVYASGNAFLDSLAQFRVAHGAPALSVNWGTWGEVGMAVEQGRSATGEMLRGAGTIATAQGLDAFGRLMRQAETHAAVMPIDWAELARAYRGYASDRFLATLVGTAGSQGSDASRSTLSLSTLLSADESQRADLVHTYVRAEAARVLGMTPERLDPTLPLASLGFDSLMAVQLKNSIESDLGTAVPMVQFLQGPSVAELVPLILSRLGSAPPPAAKEAEALEWEEGSL